MVNTNAFLNMSVEMLLKTPNDLLQKSDIHNKIKFTITLFYICWKGLIKMYTVLVKETCVICQKESVWKFVMLLIFTLSESYVRFILL